MIPIAGTTNSGIQFFKWTQRFLFVLAQNRQEEGWVFQRSNGTRAFASDYKVKIFEKLETIQATTSLIDPEVVRSGKTMSCNGQDEDFHQPRN